MIRNHHDSFPLQSIHDDTHNISEFFPFHFSNSNSWIRMNHFMRVLWNFLLGGFEQLTLLDIGFDIFQFQSRPFTLILLPASGLHKHKLPKSLFICRLVIQCE